MSIPIWNLAREALRRTPFTVEGYPKTCVLCQHQIESSDDAMWWHGYGNCVDITDEMMAQWKKEAEEESGQC